MRSLGWALVQADWHPYKRKRLGLSHTHRGPCEDTRRRWPSTSQGERSGTDPSFTDLRRNQPCLTLDTSTLDFWPPDCETINVCCWSRRENWSSLEELVLQLSAEAKVLIHHMTHFFPLRQIIQWVRNSTLFHWRDFSPRQVHLTK